MTKPLLITLVCLLSGTHALRAEPPHVQIDHKSPVTCLAWSSNGQLVAAGTTDGTITITDAATGKQVRSLQTIADSGPGNTVNKQRNGETILCLAFSNDAKKLVFNHAKSIDTWEFSAGKQKWNLNNRPDSPPTDKLALMVNGEEIVGMGIAWFTQMRLDRMTVGGSLEPNPGGGGCAGIAPDGTVGGWCNSKGLLRWRKNTSLLKGAMASINALQVGKAHCIAFGPGAKLLVVGGIDQTVQLWDLGAKKVIGQLSGLEKPAVQMSIAANGRALAALAADDKSIRVWDVDRHATRWELDHDRGSVGLMALSPDGRMLATTAKSGKAVFLWKCASRQVTHKGAPLSVTGEELAELWTKLVSTDDASADAAWQKLGAAGDNAIPFLRERIRAFAGSGADRKRIDKLVKEIDSEKFATREHALADLIAAGEWALVPLQILLDGSPSSEAKTRANLILQKIAVQAPTAERLAIFEAIDLLENVRTAKAFDLLKEIEHESLIPQVNAEASRALERLKR
jgi:WD40 repeat protein